MVGRLVFWDSFDSKSHDFNQIWQGKDLIDYRSVFLLCLKKFKKVLNLAERFSMCGFFSIQLACLQVNLSVNMLKLSSIFEPLKISVSFCGDLTASSFLN